MRDSHRHSMVHGSTLFTVSLDVLEWSARMRLEVRGSPNDSWNYITLVIRVSDICNSPAMTADGCINRMHPQPKACRPNALLEDCLSRRSQICCFQKRRDREIIPDRGKNTWRLNESLKFEITRTKVLSLDCEAEDYKFGVDRC